MGMDKKLFKKVYLVIGKLGNLGKGLVFTSPSLSYAPVTIYSCRLYSAWGGGGKGQPCRPAAGARARAEVKICATFRGEKLPKARRERRQRAIHLFRCTDISRCNSTTFRGVKQHYIGIGKSGFRGGNVSTVPLHTRLSTIWYRKGARMVKVSRPRGAAPFTFRP